jgi:hypothetical protein
VDFALLALQIAPVLYYANETGTYVRNIERKNIYRVVTSARSFVLIYNADDDYINKPETQVKMLGKYHRSKHI